MKNLKGSAVNKIIKITKKCGNFLQCFRKKIKFFFALKKLKKTPSKVAQKNSNPLFFPYCQLSPNSPNKRIHVPKCGPLINCI